MNRKVNLWGKEFEIERDLVLVKELAGLFETLIAKDTDTILNNRFLDVPFKKSIINGRVCNNICPYAWENIEYIENAIKNAEENVNSLLKMYGIKLNPNWEELNKKWLEENKRLEQKFGEAIGEATQSALQRQVRKYNQTYYEELAKDYGLSFGVVSNSLTAHLLYAAQSAAKERKDHERAEQAAINAIRHSEDEITIQIFEQVYPLYIKVVEPAFLNLLSEYYSYIAILVSKELGYDYEKISNDIENKENIRSLLEEETDDKKTIVLNSFYVDICSGDVVLYALLNDLVDKEFVAFFREAPKLLLKNTEKSIKEYLLNDKKNCKMFNKELFSAKNLLIIKTMKELFDNLTYNDVLESVYGDEIKDVIDKFEAISKAAINRECLEKFAKINKGINVDDVDVENIIELYNVLNVSKLRVILESLNYKSDINEVKKRIKELDIEVRNEFERQKKLEREKAETEREQKILLEKKKRAIGFEIDRIERELRSLGLALFGEKAKRKAELLKERDLKKMELNKLSVETDING